MRHPIIGVFVFMLVGWSGCRQQAAPPLQGGAPQVQQEQPTKERPIVLNRTVRGGGLIFGGWQGRERMSLEFGDAFIRCAISPDGRRAATITHDRNRTQARWVTFFNQAGNVVKNIMLPAPTSTKAPLSTTSMDIHLDNYEEAVVVIKRAEVYGGCIPVGAERSVEYFYVRPWMLKSIKATTDEQVQVLFPPSGGIVLLRTTGEPHLVRRWHVERYDQGLELRWRKEVEARQLGYLSPKDDFSVVKYADRREFIHFRKDGSFEVEQPHATASRPSGP